MDCREQILQEIGSKLVMRMGSEEDYRKCLAIVTMCLEKYELTERSTELGFCDDTNEKLVKLYAGTLLTEGKSEKTVYGYIRIIKRFMDAAGKNVCAITSMDVRIWLAKLQESVSLRTCENYRLYLSSFFAWLKREKIVGENPMESLKPIKYDEKEPKAFSDVEIDALRMVTESVRDRAILELLLSSGMRIAEMCALNISDIDFRKREISIKKSKGRKARTAFFSDLAAIYLKKYLRTRKDDEEYLFITRKHTRLTTDAARDIFIKMGEQANVENAHPHRCRRTFATTMSKKGMNIYTIQRLLGHKNINTTTKYIQIDYQAIESEYRKYA